MAADLVIVKNTLEHCFQPPANIDPSSKEIAARVADFFDQALK